MVSSLAWSKNRIKRLPLAKPASVFGMRGALPVPFGIAEGSDMVVCCLETSSSSSEASEPEDELEST